MKYHNLVSCMEGEADVIWPTSEKAICYSEQQQKIEEAFCGTSVQKGDLKNSPARACFWTVKCMTLSIEIHDTKHLIVLIYAFCVWKFNVSFKRLMPSHFKYFVQKYRKVCCFSCSLNFLCF